MSLFGGSLSPSGKFRSPETLELLNLERDVLLISKRLDRIQTGGFLCGVESEEDADGAGEEKGDGDNLRPD